jgi:hypothetical protein
MASITTAMVGLNAQPLAPAPVKGAAAEVITILNLDAQNTVSLGSSPSHVTFPLGPGSSTTLSAPVWASAAVPLLVGIIPGSASYAGGSLTISGPVTAEISGPVDANVTGTVEVSAGSVTIVEDAAATTGVASASALQYQTGASPVVLVTMPSAGRIWAVSLACTVNTDAGYTPARQQAHSAVVIQSDPAVYLLVTDIGISGPTQEANQALSIQLPGLYVAAGTEIELDINSAAGIAGATIEASATVIYSIP